MASYLSFKFKKITKSNLTILTTGILIVLSFGILLLNAQANKEMQLLPQAKDNLKMQKTALKNFQQSLNKYSKSSERYKLTKKSIADTHKQIATTSELITALKKEDWKTVYNIKYKEAKQVLNIQKRDGADKEVIDGLTKNIKQFKYLKAHPMPYEATPAQTGYQFLLELNSVYLPIIFTLIIIFILVQVYSDSYRDRLDIAQLLPLSNTKIVSVNLTLGVLSAILIFGLVNLLVFLGSSALYGTGSIAYPVAKYELINGQSVVNFVPTNSLIMPTMGLLLIVGIFIVVAVQLISRIIKRKMSALFVSLAVILGISIATNVIEPLQKVAHWLPTTYLSAVNVVSGEFAARINNYNVNWQNGIFFTILWICGLLIFDFLSFKLIKR